MNLENGGSDFSDSFRKLRLENPDLQFAPLPNYSQPKLSGPKENVQTISKVWLISFTDIIGLMLTFFVMMFAMSEIDTPNKTAPNTAEQPLMEIGQFLGPRSVAGDQDVISLNRLDFNSSLEIGYLQRLLENMKENSSLLGRVQILIDQDNRRLFVTLPQDLLFESGSVSINERGQKAVAELAQILSKIPNQIEVVGHADPRPPSGGRSNWEFSLERAVAVANALRKNNYERPIPIKGHSSGLYEMLPKTLSEAERLSLSRRVDIIINNHDGSQQERYGIGYPE